MGQVQEIPEDEVGQPGGRRSPRASPGQRIAAQVQGRFDPGLRRPQFEMQGYLLDEEGGGAVVREARDGGGGR